ncbi:helix-turn-helix transcriptional regulator [Endozoicomonas euniceicola]|uniref:Helix-turn-helix domain-containing protein n=1 Tax=Endozoicomonas euniceicola TaxID=1234143 RepID=A0ABY6H2X7_9GAMM|nr:hypothetical protein [Endozoicomonas euniceicola]UYM18596.1 hypothetical protein NX720_12075 [Endozoicomonas euniceicola]
MKPLNMDDFKQLLNTESEAFVYAFLSENNIVPLQFGGQIIVTEQALNAAVELKGINQDLHLLTQKEVMKATKVSSRTTILKERKKGRFPEPVNPESKRNLKWRKSDIQKWLEGKKDWSN